MSQPASTALTSRATTLDPSHARLTARLHSLTGAIVQMPCCIATLPLRSLPSFSNSTLALVTTESGRKARYPSSLPRSKLNEPLIALKMELKYPCSWSLRRGAGAQALCRQSLQATEDLETALHHSSLPMEQFFWSAGASLLLPTFGVERSSELHGTQLQSDTTDKPQSTISWPPPTGLSNEATHS